MASYKRVVLTERDNNLTESVAKNYGTNAAHKQLEKFDNTYTSKKLNELYNEFDAITFNAPSISNATISQVNAFVEQKSEISFKTKLYLTSAVLITLLLAFLTLYNVFVINGLNGGIKLLQEEVIVTENDYKTLYDYYNQLKNSTAITERVAAQGFSEISSNSIISIPLTETNSVANLEFNSNWFNEFCNFLGGMFGG